MTTRVGLYRTGRALEYKPNIKRINQGLARKLRDSAYPLRLTPSGQIHIYPQNVFKIIQGLDSPGRDLVLRAYEYAHREFKGIKRKSGKSSISHLINTALILREKIEIKDPELLAAGLLHDIIEDTKVTRDDLIREFGTGVADLVYAETKLSEALEGEERDLVNFIKLFKSMSVDPRVALLKAADCLDNMMDQEVFLEHKQREHSDEAMLYASIMEGMRVWEMRTSLEDRAYRYYEPGMFEIVERFAVKRIESANQILERFAADAKVLLEASGVKNVRIEVRQRAISELFRKMERKNLTFEEVFSQNPLYMSFILVEVGREDVDECFKAINALRNPANQNYLNGFIRANKEVADHINSPREDGYRALQTEMHQPGELGRLLVTVTTKGVNDYNRLGLAAVGKTHEFKEEWHREITFDWLKVLGDEIKGARSTAEVKEQVIGGSDYIRVYTPRGDEIKLRRGSSVLDFAYSIHGELLFEAVGAFVNGKGRKKSLFYKMKAGDIIEIVKGEAHPSVIWLDNMQSPSAKDHLIRFLRGRDGQAITRDAMRALNEAGSKYRVDAWQLIDTRLFHRYVAERLGAREEDVKNLDQDRYKLIIDIGEGRISAKEVAEGLNRLYLKALEQLTDKKEKMERIHIKLNPKDEKGVLSKLTQAIHQQGFNISRIDLTGSETEDGRGEILLGVDVIRGRQVEGGDLISQIQRIQVLTIAKEFDVGAHYYLMPGKKK